MINFIHKHLKKITAHHVGYAVMAVIISLLVINFVSATTPNPGHPWTDIGNGNWQVVNTQTGTRSFTFPDADATILTSNAAVTAPQGGTGQTSYSIGDLLYASTSSALSKLNDIATGNVLISGGVGVAPSWGKVGLATHVSGILPAINGGTNIDTSASTGVPSIAAGTWSINGQLPATLGGTGIASPGTSGNILASTGTFWASTAPASILTTATRPVNTTGAVTATSVASLTAFKVGMFTVPENITVNQISAAVTAVTTAGTLKMCVYTENGATKKIDVTTAAPAVGTLTTAVGSVLLTPGNYYVAVGCATNCSDTLSFYGSGAFTHESTATPASKEVYEGTVTMTSGTCNATITTTTAGITGAASSTVNARLDN
jgi:hypothetical protein